MKHSGIKSKLIGLFIIIFSCCISSPITAQYANPVEAYGQLQVEGAKIVSSKTGLPVQLKGMSFFWDIYAGSFYTAQTVYDMVDNWNCEILRAAIGTTTTDNSYPSREKVRTIVNACREKGVYVIIDFHTHHLEDEIGAGEDFFWDVATEFGAYDNVIFEVYNEPLGPSENSAAKNYWKNDIKPAAEKMIKKIRDAGSDNLVVVGTPFYSSQPKQVLGDEIHDGNVAYVFHYYAWSHTPPGGQDNDDGGWAYSNIEPALGVIPLFCTEWGTCHSNGGRLGFENTHSSVNSDIWWSILDQYDISSCMWAINNDSQASAIWNNWNTSASGGYIHYKLNEWTKEAWWRHPDIPLTVDAGDDIYIHANTTSVQLNGWAVGGEPNYYYTWAISSNAGNASLSQIYTATPTVENLCIGKYTFKLSVSDGSTNAEDEVVLIVLPEDFTFPNNTDLIDDIEDNDITTLWNGHWDVYDDHANNGASVITGQQDLPQNNYIKAEYILDKGNWEYDPYCGVEVHLKQDETAMNISDCERISYTYKGSAHDFRAEMSTIKDRDFHKKAIPASTEWTSVNIEWSALHQSPDWGDDVGAIDKTTISAFSWQVSAASGTGTIEIDNVRCEESRGIYGENNIPICYAGENIETESNEAQLDGSKSFDIDDDVLSFAWTQIEGPGIAIISSPLESISNIGNLTNGNYRFVLSAYDGKLTNTDTVDVTVSNQIASLTINLQEGWNLISLNVVPANASVSDLLPNATLVKSENGFYRSGQAAFLNSIQEIESGKGYLVYNSIDEDILVTGMIEALQTVSLHKGWNVLCVPYSIYCTDLPFEYEIIKNFNAFYDPNEQFNSLEILEAGRAYYVKADTSQIFSFDIQ